MALWVQPMIALLAGYGAYFASATVVMVPLGLSVPLDPTWDLAVELTPIYAHRSCNRECTSRALALAVGPAWTVRPDGPWGGLFVQPKLLGVLAHTQREQDIAPIPVGGGRLQLPER